ncbi:MAG: ImmA/IrrE family metallo-endopeptidase [Lachnospiraceae bacterium]
MSNSREIYDKANAIVRKAGTRNPLRIANELGFDVRYVDYFNSLIGMYTYQHRIKAIFINNRLEEYMLRMVVAHEIGHDVLHRDIAKNGAMKEFVLFDMKDRTEYEANLFAAHLLIDTNEFIELAYDGTDVSAMASHFCVNINLILMKISDLIHLGYDLRMPMEAKANFMKDIRV